MATLGRDGTRMLKIDHLGKTFGATVALDDVSLSIGDGEMVGVIGRSGAGKSTLLRSLNRLVEPDSGSIRFEDIDVLKLRSRDLRSWRKQCAMVFQQFNLVPRLDVLTNVLIGRLNAQSTLRTLLKMFTASDRALAVLMLERVEMAQHAFQRVDTLSGGQQQRVAIARALIQQPRIILADEPIASLDPRSAQRVMEILRNINRDDGTTVVCNLHTLDAARAYCQRIIGMRAGRVVYDGSPADLSESVLRNIYGLGDEHFDESLTNNHSVPQAMSR